MSDDTEVIETEEIETDEEDQETQYAQEVEKAKLDGWRPKEQWDRSPDEWVDAPEYNKRGEQINAILRSRLKKTEARLAEIEKVGSEFKKFHDDAMKAKERENKKLLTELEAEREKAVSEGDGKAFTAADKKIREIQAEQKQDKNGTPDLSPDAKRWLDAHPQYETDKKFAALADGLAGRIQDEIKKGQRAQLSTVAFYEVLTEELKDAAPEFFENGKRNRQTVETGGNRASTNRKSRTFANLPDDAKQAFERFKKQMPDFTEEEYVSQYDWD